MAFPSHSGISSRQPRRPRKPRAVRRILAGSILGLLAAPGAHAATIYLDTSSGTAGLLGGAAIWDAGTTSVWTLDPAGLTATSPYTSGSDVIFNTSSAATVTVNGTVTANSLSFGPGNLADTISGASGLINLGGGANAGISVLGGGNAANTISAAIGLLSSSSFSNANSGALTVGQITGTATTGNTQTISLSTLFTGGIALNGIIGDGAGGGQVGLVINSQNPAGGTVTLSGANTFSGGVLIKAGSLTTGTVTGGSALGTGTLTLGDTAANTLAVTANLGGTQGTFNNAIALNSGTTGALTLASGNGTTGLVLTGGVTGTNNFTINESSTASWNFTTAAVNNSGTVTNSSSGTGAITISGGVGANVTSVIENSTTSALTIGTTALTVNGTGTNLINAKGTALLTLTSGTTGTGNLVLQNNSTTANGVTISGATINHTGNLTNAGLISGATANGATLISANIGGNVLNVTENSLGALTLSGIDSYTGATIIRQGTINLNGPNGALTATSAVNVFGGGVFSLGDATAANGLANRINTAATLTLGDATGGGALVVIRGSTTANSQSFTSLAVGGSASISGSAAAGGASTVTFSGASPYTRTLGGLVTFTTANNALSFTNAPSGTGNVSNNILVGAVLNATDFVKAAAGAPAAPAYTAATTTSLGGPAADTTVTGITSTVSAATTNSLLLIPTTSAANVVLSGTNTIVSGGIIVSSAGTSTSSITGGTLTPGQAGGDLWVYNSHTLTIGSVLADNSGSGLTYGGSQALTLSGANTYTGLTSVQGLQLTLATAGTNGTTTVAVPGNLNLTGSVSAAGVPTGSIVQLGGSNEIANTSVVTLGGGAGNTFRLAGFTQTLAGLQTSTTTGTASTGNVVENFVNTGPGVLILNNTADYTFDGIFRNGTAGTLAFTKQGPNKFTLQNSRNVAVTAYTGATTISGGTLALLDNGNGATISGFASAITNNATLELDDTSLSTAVSLGVVVGGSGGLNVNAGTAAIVVKGANTFQGNVAVNTGTLRVTTAATALGASTNTVTVASGAALDVGVVLTNTNALTINGVGPTGFGSLTDSSVIGTYAGPVTLGSPSTIGTSSTFALTVAGTITGSQPLTLNEGSTGALTLTNVNNTGSVSNVGLGSATTTITTLGPNVTSLAQTGNSPLTITNAVTPSATLKTFTSTGAGLFSLTGGVGTGAFDLAFSANSTGGITTGAINTTGAVTNSGTGPGTVTLGSLASTVTAISQTGASPLTVTGAIIPNATIDTVTSTGSGLLTLSGGYAAGTGTNNLTFNANSVGGITVGALAVAAGTVTNSGSGTGVVTISGIIGAGVTTVTQSSPTSQLTLSNAANTYTGATTISQGILSVGNVVVTAGASGLGNASSPIVLGAATTKGTLIYTGAAATLTRNLSIQAGGGEIDTTTAALTLLPGASIDLTAGPLTLGGANSFTVGSATTATALFTGASVLTKTGAGTLTLSTLGGTVDATGAMPINLQGGTISVVTTNVTTNNILGTGLITITPGAILTFNYGGGTGSTLSNAFTIAAGSGLAIIKTTSGTISDSTGAITFAPGSTAATILSLQNTNSTTAALTLGGAVTGTGTIQFNPTNTAAAVTLNSALNETGTISNVGTSTSTATISGTATIGSGITGISQAGANPFTVAAAIPLSASLNTFTSTGAGLFTFSGGFTGAQPLTLNANSAGGITVSGGAISNGGGLNLNTTGTGAITISSAVNSAGNIALSGSSSGNITITTAINPSSGTGTIVNSGAGNYIATLSGNLGANVTSVTESGSFPGQLILSGTNTNIGNYVTSGGVLTFTTTAALNGYATSAATGFGRISAVAGSTVSLPFGGATSITSGDLANLLNGTYPLYPTGSSLGLDTTSATSTTTALGTAIVNPSGVVLGFTKTGINTLSVSSANSYTGPTAVLGGTLSTATLNSVTGGVTTSGLGTPATVAIGTISLGGGSVGGVLSYTGPGETTDRVINLSGATGGGGLDQSGSGTVVFTSPLTFTGVGNKTLTLSGSTASDGTISGTIAGGILGAANGALTISKTGTGTWNLTGTGNTAQNILIAGGTLNTGPNGITLSDAGAATLQASGTATVNGKIILNATGAAANGVDFGSSAGVFTINANIVEGATPTVFVDFNPSGGTVILNGNNNWAGQSNLNSAEVVQIATLNTVGSVTAHAVTSTHQTTSNLGAPTTAGNGVLLFSGGTLKYVGAGENTDRGVSLAAGGTLDQSSVAGLLYLGGNVGNTGGVRVLTLQGSTAGTGELAGVISDNSTNTTGITKAGTGAWTLSGVNTYTGPTLVNGGNLILSQGSGTGVLGNSPITINSGGALSPLAGASGFFAGNTATPAKGATLTLNAGGTLNLADGVIGNFNLLQNSTFAGAAATFAGGSLNFDIGTTVGSNDAVDVRLNNATGTGLAASSGSNAIAINAIGGSLASGTYNLILSNATGTGLSAANFFLASPNLNVGGTLYNLSLSLSGGNEVLTVGTGSPAVAPGLAFWTASIDASWASQPGGSGTATNFAASATGAPNTFALPGSTTNVTFTANSAASLTSTLDQSFSINSLTFSGTGTSNTVGSTIASGTGTNTLTLNATGANGNPAGNGLTILPGSGANAISANVVLGGNQLWTNNASTATTVSGVISESTAGTTLSKAGTGTLILSGLNTFTGSFSINAGAVSVSTLGTTGNPGGLGEASVVNIGATTVGGTLLYTGAGETTDRVINLAGTTGGATIDQSGAGSLKFTSALTAAGVGLKTLTLQGSSAGTGEIGGAIVDSSSGATNVLKLGTDTWTLSGASTYTGNTTVSGGTLNITGTLTGSTTASTLALGGTAATTVVNLSNNFTGLGITGGNVVGAVAVYNQTGGIVNVPGTSNVNTTYAAGSAGYGYINVTGGSLNDGQRLNVTGSPTAGTSPTGVVFVGGTGTVSAGEFILIAYNSTGAAGELTVAPGGTIAHNGASQPIAITWTSNNEYGILNVAGGTVNTNTKPVEFGATSQTGVTGLLNLSSGTLSTNVAIANLSTAGSNNYINFVGGTLQAGAAVTNIVPTASTTLTNTIFGPVVNSSSPAINTAVGVTQDFAGGFVFNSGGFSSTIASPLKGAGGTGVTQSNIAIPSAGNSGYVGAPLVEFAAPAAGGVPASGYALIGSGQVIGIVITEPGTYAAGETPAISLLGGGGSIATFATSALNTLNGNVGGVTKLGAGTLTLSGANTFGGVVDIKGGVLAVANLTNGGVVGGLGQSTSAATNVLLDGGAFGYSGTVAGTTDRNFTLAASGGGFDASGTTLGTLTLTSANALTVTPGLGAATLVLQGSGTGATGAGSIGTLLADGTGTTLGLTKLGAGAWTLANAANTYTGPTTLGAGTLIVSKLDVGGNSSNIGASSSAAANLVFNGGILQYVGTGSTTDRNYTFGNATTASGGTVDSEGTGPLVISGSLTGANTAAGSQTLTLIANAGSGNNSIAGVSDSGATALTAVTKSGPGTWVLAGSAYSGATTLSSGTLQFAGSLTGATPIGIAPSTALQFRENGAGNSGTINHTANNITATATGTVTIDTANNGSNTGNTVALGVLSSGAATTANAVVYNFLGANGYTQSYTGLLLPGSGGQNTTLVPTTTSVVISGSLTNQINPTATGHFDTVFLDGTSTGNALNGVISDSSIFVSVGNGDTRITKQNSSTWTLGGASTYHGATAVNGGTLGLTGSLGNTPISVAAGATFAALPGAGSVTAGNNATAAAGATLSVAATGIFSMVDGAIGTFNLVQNSTFATAGLTLASASLNLDLANLASGGADQIVVSGGPVSAAITGINTVNFTVLGTSLTPGTYPILTAPGLAAGNTLFKFSNGTATESVIAGSGAYSVTLTGIAGVEQITIGNPITNLIWTGQTNGNGTANSVWVATPAGNNNFADGTPAAQDYTEGSAVTFQDLNPIGAVPVTNSTVTVDAAGVNPGAVTVNNATVNYTIQNAGGSIGIAGATGLTKTGAGKLTLLGVNTYTGPTAINGGIVNVGVADNGTTAGPLGATTGGGTISFGGGTLQYSAANSFDYSSRFSTGPANAFSIDTNGQTVTYASVITGTGSTLTKLGAGTLILSNNANTYTGNTIVNAGTLTISGTNAQPGPLLSPQIIVNNGGILNLTNGDTIGYTANRAALVINSGGTVQNNASGKRNTIANVITMTGGTLAGTSLGDANSGAYSLNAGITATSDAAGNPATVSANLSLQSSVTFTVSRGAFVAAGAPDLVVSGPITPYGATTQALTKSGNGILTLSGTNTYTGGTTLLGGTVFAASNQALGAVTGGLILGDTTNNAATLSFQNSAGTTFFNQTVGSLTVNTAGTTLNTDTIMVGAGKTFTVNGGFTVGPVPTVNSELTKLTIGGGGAFVVTTAAAATIQIGGNNSATTSLAENATLDLTGLATASISASTTGTINIGDTTGTNNTGNQAAVFLPTPAVSNTTVTSTLTAATLAVAPGGGFNNNATQINQLVLGTGLTTLNVGTLNVGAGARDIGTITFANASGNLKVRAADGTSRATFNIATGGATTGTTGPSDLVDLTGHSADLLLNLLNVGNQARIGNLQADFKFDTGTLNATGFTIGFRTGSAAATNTLTDNITIGGGTVIVGASGVDMGTSTNTSTTATATVGTLSVTGGTVTIANNATLGAAVRLGNNTGAGLATVSDALSISGGSVTLAGDIVTGTTTRTTSTVTLSGGTLDLGGHNIGGANAITALNFQAGTLQNVAQINNGGGLTKTTAGTLILSGTNSYSGATTVSGGILQAGSNTGLSASSALTLANTAGVSLVLNSNSPTIGSLAGGGAAGGSVSLGSGTLTTGSDNSSTTYTGVISGTNGGLTKIGTGTQTLSGLNLYTGPTTINAGSLKAGISGALSAASAVTLANVSGALLDLNGTNNTIGSLTGGGATGGNVNLGSATLTTGADNTSTSFGGAIGGTNGGLTKVGTGTQTLTGANTYTGPTVISAGALSASITGSLHTTSSVTANANTTFSIGSTGISNVINNAATGLTLAGGTFLGNGGSEGSAAVVTGTGTTGTNATGLGLLTLSGSSTLNFGANGNETFVFSNLSLTNGAILTIDNWSNTSFDKSQLTPTTSGGLGDDRLIFATNVTSLLGQIHFTDGGTATAINLGGNYYEIGEAIPEPSALLLLTTAGAGLAGFRRRRRRAARV